MHRCSIAQWFRFQFLGLVYATVSDKLRDWLQRYCRCAGTCCIGASDTAADQDYRNGGSPLSSLLDLRLEPLARVALYLTDENISSGHLLGAAWLNISFAESFRRKKGVHKRVRPQRKEHGGHSRESRE